MNTLHHGFWTYVAMRKRKDVVKYAIIGSLIPDIVYYIMFFYILFFGDIISSQ